MSSKPISFDRATFRSLDHSDLANCVARIALRVFDLLLDLPAEQQAERRAFDSQLLKEKPLYSIAEAEMVSKLLQELSPARGPTAVLTFGGLIKRLLPELTVLVEHGYSQEALVDTLLDEVAALGQPSTGRSAHIRDLLVEGQADDEELALRLLETKPLCSVADAEKISRKLRRLACSRWLTPTLTVLDLARRLTPELTDFFDNSDGQFAAALLEVGVVLAPFKAQ